MDSNWLGLQHVLYIFYKIIYLVMSRIYGQISRLLVMKCLQRHVKGFYQDLNEVASQWDINYLVMGSLRNFMSQYFDLLSLRAMSCTISFALMFK